MSTGTDFFGPHSWGTPRSGLGPALRPGQGGQKRTGLEPRSRGFSVMGFSPMARVQRRDTP